MPRHQGVGHLATMSVPKLTHLNLSSNKIGLEGLIYLATMSLASLTNLVITNNKLKKADFETFEDCKITKSPSYYVTMGEIARQIGWKGMII